MNFDGSFFRDSFAMLFFVSVWIILIAKGLIKTNQWSMVELQKNLNRGGTDRSPLSDLSENTGVLK
jgi:hypothetical protein